MAIEHIVIIVKENHAFDNYFGTFPNANGERLGQAENPPPFDPPHDHRTWMRRAGDPRFHLQYAETDIPAYFDYARKYTLCDNYFTEVAGPSTPNHLMPDLDSRTGFRHREWQKCWRLIKPGQ